ncbi:hypothetical protein BD779DRAFT_778751 [Infundibulicybe gibba]|nr:hypothetical protein BD779DRAFT_778751 [Infundibulicybe gibba]
MACGITDRDIRREAARNSSPRLLIPCSACRMTFYCSTAHQEAAQDVHTSAISPDVQSQCQINQEIRADIEFDATMAGDGIDPFYWAPERTKESWSSVIELGWMDEFAADLKQHFGLRNTVPLGPWVRGASVALSMPMSILWALEILNIPDESWTRKSALTIHIVGARELEVMNGQIFEEILHRLPEVKTLNLVLCGPQLSQMSISLDSELLSDMETCPECRRKGRKRLHYYYPEMYYDFMRGHGATLPKPDLAVAFNSDSSDTETSSWPETMQCLVQNQIPSLFTAYNQEGAQNDAELLTQAGAELVFGPEQNPWGSIQMKPEPDKISGFCAVNGWVAGVFGG